VLAIALIPSAALLVTGATVAGYLVSEGLSARSFASQTLQSIGPIVQFESATQQERTITLRAVEGDRQALAGLRARWDATNVADDNLTKAVTPVQGTNPQVLDKAMAQSRAAFARLPAMRQNVLAGRVTAAEVDGFYTQLIDIGMGVFELSAPSAPDSVTAVDEITTLDLLSALDLHSRAAGLGAGWAGRGALSQPERLMVAQLAGAYRNQLPALVPRLVPSAQAEYGRLVAGSAWHLATAGEDDLIQRGKLSVPAAGWLAAEDTVSAGLLGLWEENFRQAENAGVAGASRTLSRSVVLGSLVLALAVAAFVAALVLANGLVRRLRRLRGRTLELAEERLPSMVARIGAGERVDVDSEMPPLDYGSDEIGQVAEAFNAAQRTAVAAAAAEARTRGGVNKVFLDIAHRSQLVVHRQLELLDVAEARQGDPEHLEMLFRLDHLATRARRNAENLLILGGGQPGRKWRQPAGLEDVVRSAVSETEQFARVSTVRLPEVRVLGAVVGDLIHLLAELVDNATTFSPPESAVQVHGNVVGKGVVVEVEDQGLGIEPGERERLNETLRHPLDFQAMAVAGQRHLGLFVVGQLAQRHGIAVSLLESAYGGIKAIVLIPAGALEDGAGSGGSSALSWPARNGELPSGGGGQGLVPLPAGGDDVYTRGRPGDEPAGSGLLPAAWPGSDADKAPASAPPWELATDLVSDPPRRGRAPLPRRERQANLAPGLRLEPDGTADHDAPHRPPRSPEQARGSMSAFQRGTRAGRDLAGEDNR
jgi:signal transduction histidine kinase